VQHARRSDDDRNVWIAALRGVRTASEALAAGLTPEDQTIQSMPDVSPTKWHLAHVSWFFETFLLVPHLAGYHVFDDRYRYLFNSYYEAVGPRQTAPRAWPPVATVSRRDRPLSRPCDGSDGAPRRHGRARDVDRD